MQSTFQRKRVLLLHIAFWWVYFSFFFYQISFHRKPVGSTNSLADSIFQVVSMMFVDALFQVVSMMFISYLNYFFFLSRFLKNRNFGKYLLEFTVPFVLFIIAYIHIKRYMVDGYTHHEEWVYSQRFIVQISITTLFIVIFVGMLKFLEDWFELEAKKKEVENERLTAELRFLKAQINPHFLFNTLNNLYYLAFTQSPNTTEVISKLSQMMRYMIYDSNHPKVLLSKEIEYMENYISLEKLRLNDEIPINFEIRGNPDQVLIVPLILITFLENSFKHGVSNNYSEAWININIFISTKECIYSVKNSKLPAKPNSEEKSGIGLQNVQRRLELSYPGSYELKVEDEPDSYSVQLKLILS